jgi:cbb3-type cytochrome oxidase subunit 3
LGNKAVDVVLVYMTLLFYISTYSIYREGKTDADKAEINLAWLILPS